MPYKLILKRLKRVNYSANGGLNLMNSDCGEHSSVQQPRVFQSKKSCGGDKSAKIAENRAKTEEFWKIAKNCMKTKEYWGFYGGGDPDERSFLRGSDQNFWKILSTQNTSIRK